MANGILCQVWILVSIDVDQLCFGGRMSTVPLLYFKGKEAGKLSSVNQISKKCKRFNGLLTLFLNKGCVFFRRHPTIHLNLRELRLPFFLRNV